MSQMIMDHAAGADRFFLSGVGLDGNWKTPWGRLNQNGEPSFCWVFFFVCIICGLAGHCSGW